MEFTYSLTLREAREAFGLYFWNLRRKIALGVLAFAVLTSIAGLFFVVVGDMSQGISLDRSLSSSAANTMLIVLAVLLFLLAYIFFLVPWIVLRPLRRNPALLSVRRATADAEAFAVEIEGGSSRMNWTLYKFWREGKNVIIVKLISGQYQMVSKRALSQGQLEELRGILTAALPKKK
jgi:YcxB-like protein